LFEINYKNNFKKDIELAQRRGKDLAKLKEIIIKLSQGTSLEKKHKDHVLTGKYKGRRECHLEPNWLLIYKIENSLIILERLGSHSDLFKRKLFKII
jgi:mRNA interferase YafQ